jgi:aerobic-type carbon monoxide dehydrogenase small subunit (CoxS/CutS family)
MTQLIPVSVLVNGSRWEGELPPQERLLDFLRQRLRLTGTKWSCESQMCGACTVLVEGEPVSSCSYLAFEADGKDVTTVEGLSVDGRLNPLQESFVRNVATQCGYCTPGQLMAATALQRHHPSPGFEELRHWMDGNICRCGCYPAIATAIRETTNQLSESEAS